MSNRKILLNEVFLFLLIGGVTFLIDVMVTVALYNVFHFPAFIASCAGFLSGFFFNFPMNRKRVFKHSKNDRFSFAFQISAYATLALINLFLTGFLTEFLVTLGTNIAIAKVIVTGIIAVWNFILFKFFIFSKKPQFSANVD